MGIDINTFNGGQYELFKCPVCLDVLEDPVTTDPCDHLFCKSCFNPGRCPICRVNVSRTKPINRVLNQIYELLTLKCSFNGCREVVTIGNRKSHEQKCPYNICQDCGKAKNGVHNCVQNLKVEVSSLVSEITMLNKKLQEMAAMIATPQYPVATVRPPCPHIITWGQRYYECVSCKVVCGNCAQNCGHDMNGLIRPWSSTSTSCRCPCGGTYPLNRCRGLSPLERSHDHIH